MGANVIFLRYDELQVKRGELLEDTARIISDLVDLIVIRMRDHDKLMSFAKYSKVPVINALTMMYHPTQALTDIMTILEIKGKLKGLKIAYVGDGYNNVCHSLILICSKLGLNLWVASPKGYEPCKDVIERALSYAMKSNANIIITNNPISAVKDANVIYTDVFVSMGRESERDKRLRDFQGWQVNKRLVKYAKDDYIFMHCLPAHRGEEVSSDVIDDEKHSVVWIQAKNKLYVVSILMMKLLNIDFTNLLR